MKIMTKRDRESYGGYFIPETTKVFLKYIIVLLFIWSLHASLQTH